MHHCVNMILKLFFYTASVICGCVLNKCLAPRHHSPFNSHLSRNCDVIILIFKYYPLPFSRNLTFNFIYKYFLIFKQKFKHFSIFSSRTGNSDIAYSVFCQSNSYMYFFNHIYYDYRFFDLFIGFLLI